MEAVDDPGGLAMAELSADRPAAPSALPSTMSAARVSASTRTVERALRLMAYVAEHEARTLSACARSTGLAPSTALRLLRTLETTGFVTRSPDGTFEAGNRLVRLGALALGRLPLVRRVRPSLQRIVEHTGESAYLVIRGTGDTAIYLDMVEGTHAIRHTSWVGRAIALEDLAVAGALRGEVGDIGYLAQRDRLEPDVTAIAAPIRWAGGVAGALNLLGPTYRIDEATLHDFGRVVAREAAVISTNLAADPGAPSHLEEVR